VANFISNSWISSRLYINGWYCVYLWLNHDPIGEKGGGINLYSFVGNDPINKRDPLGLLSDESFVYRHELKDFPAVTTPPANPADAAKGMVDAPNWNIFWPFPLNWFGKPKCNKFVGDRKGVNP